MDAGEKGNLSVTTAVLADVQPRALANFLTISEFPDRAGNGLPAIRVGCFTSAWLSVAHALFGEELDAPEFVKVFNDMVAHKDMDGDGTTMSHGRAYVQTVLGHQTIEPDTWAWHPGTEEPAILAGMRLQAGINGLILQLDAAGHMAFNESGVGGHFVAIGGYKVVGGVEYFLMANGDDVECLAGNNGHARTFAPKWLTWAQIAPGVPSALLAVLHPQSSTVGVPAGWKDDGKTLTDPNGNVAEHGFRARILAQGNWDPTDTLLMKHEVASADLTESVLVCKKHTLTWTKAGGVVVSDTGTLADLYVKALEAAGNKAA